MPVQVVAVGLSGYATTAVRGTPTSSVDAARAPSSAELDCPRLNLRGTGLDSNGLPTVACSVPTPDMWITAARTPTRLARLGEQAERVFTLKNLNTAVDHPGVPFARAADTLTLVPAVDNPHLRMNLDLYHAQIGEGNLIELVEECSPYVGEIQVADVPGRKEPGTGEIHYPAIATALDRLGYNGVICLEGWASGASENALERFRTAFTV